MSKRQNQPLSAIMLDIDHFKTVNDNYGHARGDQRPARHRRNSEKFRARRDVVCRYGGEEFCILMPATNLDGAFQLAEKLRQAIAGASIAEVAVTASFGVSCTSVGVGSSQTLIDQADEALYNSKRAGRNLTTRFDRLDPSIPRSSADREQTQAASDELIPIHAVRSLFAALLFRDPQTAEHSRRVSEMCVKVGSTWLNPARVDHPGDSCASARYRQGRRSRRGAPQARPANRRRMAVDARTRPHRRGNRPDRFQLSAAHGHHRSPSRPARMDY